MNLSDSHTFNGKFSGTEAQDKDCNSEREKFETLIVLRPLNNRNN